MKKVIYISFARLTDKFSSDWYIDYLRAKGITVEYWDIVSLVREEYNEFGEKSPDYLRILRTFSEFETLVSLPDNRNAYYVMLLPYAGRFAKSYRLLSKYHCRMLKFSWGAMPEEHTTLWRKVASELPDPLRLAGLVTSRVTGIVLRKMNLVKPFHIVFAAGKALTTIDQYAAKIVPINLFDYDNYVRVKSEKDRFVKDRYAVFLDINLPYQSDIALCGLAAVNPTTYFQSLNRFFSLLEIEYGIKVVIAAHPKSNYEAELFQSREIYRGYTPQLVKDADFVISHTSTALSYAVLNVKPVIFIYTNDMMVLYKNNVMKELRAQAKYLEAPLYNIDEITQGRQIFLGEANSTCYDKYKYDFLTTPESEHMFTADIFWREINAG